VKIFLKILGGIFALVITGAFVIFLFSSIYNYNVSNAFRCLIEGDKEACIGLLILLALGGLICFYPICYEIGNAINEHFG